MEKSRRKALLEQYKQMKTYMGVIQITNKQNGKIYIGAYPNLKNKWLTIQAQLEMGQFMNAELQRDYTALGPDAFVYEVLEEKSDEDVKDKHFEQRQMLKIWHEKLQPYGERGYNRPLK